MFKALDRSAGEVVAIKVIPLTDTDAEELKSIQKEIAFLAECNHPNIVRYYVSGWWHPVPKDGCC